jgi:hypothetical protein
MKIALRYTGDDEAMQKRLEATDGIAYFEPIDAREILATPDNEYEVDDESRKLIGMQLDPTGRMRSSEEPQKNPDGSDVINIPQLNAADAELQTGLSAEKYGRSQVVKAVPEAALPTSMMPMTTTGRPLDLEKARSGESAGSMDPAMGFQQAKQEPTERDKRQEQEKQQQNSGPASEGMTSEEMKAALKAKNVQFPADAKKAELAELVDRHDARKV